MPRSKQVPTYPKRFQSPCARPVTSPVFFSFPSQFYEEIIGAQSLDLGDETCTVGMGYHQSLRFQESSSSQDYDGHHIAIYVNGFVDMYHRLSQRSLIYMNPRFPQFNYSTEEQAVHHNEFRFLDIIDVDTGEVVYQLEHEIRSLAHPGFSCRAWVEEEATLAGATTTMTTTKVIPSSKTTVAAKATAAVGVAAVATEVAGRGHGEL